MGGTDTAALDRGNRVRHATHGVGVVVAVLGPTTVVRFEHGIEECETHALERLATVDDAVGRESWDGPLSVVTLAQAGAIRSINDAWGMFSRSRVALLPHQLWVCHRVNSSWPTRWLIADDVGLGKTIEAGLILTPLLARNAVQRLLVICPAALVGQWQERLRDMFDIRLMPYVAEADTARSDFWHLQNRVVASLQTIRMDHADRHQRLLQSPPWDLVIVDEAHHLNVDEEAGPTLGYKLVARLVEERRVASLLLFTGTPHRGKNFGFLSLLKLLRPEWFDPKKALSLQLPHLREVMIRNNKQNVTDLRGKLLFTPLRVDQETYEYSQEEAAFYYMLTEFIVSGKAYASRLSAEDARMATLVLIAMQKLASSSVAAIRRAIEGRLARIRDQRRKVAKLRQELVDLGTVYEDLESANLAEELSRLEEELAEKAAGLLLMEDEEPRLVDLVAAARRVTEETKITRVLELVESRFEGRSVLFFTEYKATQSLLMSALIRQYGDGCVTFINGDDRADEVVDASGQPRTLSQRRSAAEELFKSGNARFLVSTEAAGEGIDLQESCHTLIHVDLPWNPMRLHQRVGRLNRYGQLRPVDVVTLRNPDTVEARIWDKLNAKISSINQALAHAMDEPEDMLPLVLGMTSPSLFREVFAGAAEVPPGSLGAWFDNKTASFGGRDVLETVRDLVGSCARFDFQNVSPLLPQVDLPAMRPFFESVLRLHRRRVRRTGEAISFHTPEDWLDEPGMRASYDDMVFDRSAARKSIEKVLGVGHRTVDRAIRAASGAEVRAASLSPSALPSALAVFRIQDRVTGSDKPSQRIVVGLEINPCEPTEMTLLKDWQLLLRLNELCKATGVGGGASAAPDSPEQARAALHSATTFVETRVASLGIDFRVPSVEAVALLWPVERAAGQLPELEDGSPGDADGLGEDPDDAR